MSTYEEIPIGQLQEVVKIAQRDIFEYSIGLVRVGMTPVGPEVVLLGSGTLVSIGSIRAVLTAQHVVKILPREGRLGLILSPTMHRYDIDTQGITYLEIDRGVIDSDGPDLGAIILSPSIAGSIAAKKSFFNLDLRRDQMLLNPPPRRNGFWLIHGFIGEKTVVEPGSDGLGPITSFENLSGAGGPEEAVTVGEHDYYDFPVSYGARALAPKSFGGMSGGGLWQIPIYKNDQGEINSKTPILSGVVFYQVATTKTECGVRCHGRQSVYGVAYEAIRKGSS